MSSDTWGVLIGLLVYFLMRLIDRLLPEDTHFKFMERWMRKNKDPEVDQDSDTEAP